MAEVAFLHFLDRVFEGVAGSHGHGLSGHALSDGYGRSAEFGYRPRESRKGNVFDVFGSEALALDELHASTRKKLLELGVGEGLLQPESFDLFLDRRPGGFEKFDGVVQVDLNDVDWAGNIAQAFIAFDAKKLPATGNHRQDFQTQSEELFRGNEARAIGIGVDPHNCNPAACFEKRLSLSSKKIVFHFSASQPFAVEPIRNPPGMATTGTITDPRRSARRNRTGIPN
jgi:hypothetical protein